MGGLAIAARGATAASIRTPRLLSWEIKAKAANETRADGMRLRCFRPILFLGFERLRAIKALKATWRRSMARLG